MKTYRIEAHGEVREIYEVNANSEEEARAAFASGSVTGPYLSETSGAEITSIEVVSPEDGGEDDEF